MPSHVWRPSLYRSMFWLPSLLGALSVHAESLRVVGYVRDADSQRYLYTEVHDQELATDGAVQSGLTVYYDAQGREMARKTLDFRQHRTVPIYRMDIPAVRYAEGISSSTPQAQIFKRDGDQEERKSIGLGEGLVAADAGFNQLLQDQLAALRKGETVRFGLIVAGHTNRYKFRARKVGEQADGTRPVLQLLVEPDSMLRMLVPAIKLDYDASTRKLLSYDGVSNIIDPATGKVYRHIHIIYGGPPPKDARLPAALASNGATTTP